jgi:adenine-specific DNA methylase
MWAASPRERVIGSNSQKFKHINHEVDFGLEVKRPEELKKGSRYFLVRQGSAAELDLPNSSVDFIVTDPPYFDSVQYSDLSAFFRVWLQQLLPEGSQTGIKWDYDLEESAVSSEKNGRDMYGHYTQTMGIVFSECNRVLRKGSGRLIFTFHNWKPEGWAAITVALKRAGFGLVNRYVVHSENPISVHIANLRALTDDAILVLAPTQAEAVGSWTKPATVETSNSADFCRDCATLLGWMLEAEITEEEVRKLWKMMLRP